MSLSHPGVEHTGSVALPLDRWFRLSACFYKWSRYAIHVRDNPQGISETLSNDSGARRRTQNTGISTARPSANSVNVLSPYFENRSQNSCNSMASVLSTLAMRFKVMGTPLTIF
jgi:hypothetical protein